MSNKKNTSTELKKEQKNPQNEFKTEIEWKEEDFMDDNMKKIVKYIVIWLSSIFLIIFIFMYTFFNVNNNSVWVTEWFFSKDITIYNESGIKVINPFALNTKTTYPTSLQSIIFVDDEINTVIESKTDENTIQNRKTNIYDEIYKTKGLKVNTKDEINLTVWLTISYKLKSDIESVTYVYNNTWNGNFIEKIVIATITSSVSDIYSQYSLMDIVNKWEKKEWATEVSIWTLLKEKITNELDKRGFQLETFTFSGVQTSDWITKTIETLFNTQNELELEKTKFQTLELKNKNALKELELTNGIYSEINKNNLSVEDYQKIKMIQIFEEKWDWNTIPNWLRELLK